MVDGKTLHWIFSVPVGITISIFGLFGNLLSIIVWMRLIRQKSGGNKSTGIYLVALAVADSGLLIFFLFDDSLPSTFESIRSTYSFCFFHSYIGFPFFFLFIVSSIWLVVAVTLNRFIMVIFPMKAKSLCSTTRAYLGIAITVSCCFIINIPHFLNFRPSEVNGTYAVAETDYAKSGGAMKYEFWVHCMFLVLAPWASIAFFNGGIIYALLKRAREATEKFHKSKSAQSQSERQMTLMLLTVTFTFLILLAWQCITQCFFMLGFGKATGEWEFVNKSFAAAKLGVVINSSINFMLYCCTGTAFKKELKAVFKKGKGHLYGFSSTMSSGTKITKDSTLQESKA